MSDTQNPQEQQTHNPASEERSEQNGQTSTPAGGDDPSAGQNADQNAEPAVEVEVVEAAEQADDLHQKLQELERQTSEYKDQWLRSVAEFKNYKRRSEQERAELIRSASAGLVLKLLPIVDDFERAAASVPPEIAEHPWWAGTQLIEQKLRTILESEGVTPIEALGQDFDPNLHEAVLYEETEGQEGKVVGELQKGYKIHERVLRPTMVKVGKG